MTSYKRGWRKSGPTRVPVAKDSDMGKTMGIRKDSVIIADKINTVSPDLISGRLESCPLMSVVDDALKAALQL